MVVDNLLDLVLKEKVRCALERKGAQNFKVHECGPVIVQTITGGNRWYVFKIFSRKNLSKVYILKCRYGAFLSLAEYINY